jgi:hypothetical protein
MAAGGVAVSSCLWEALTPVPDRIEDGARYLLEDRSAGKMRPAK